ncbi:MAG: hypothetical protein HN348_05675 [Proteobacteria bacterium]|nr:hypothetical protein [Pseudomonadota bacterium]
MRLTALLVLSGCALDFADPSRAYAPVDEEHRRLHPVSIHQPTTLGVVDTTRRDVRGTPVGVSCATCHGVKPADGPADFHGAISINHGDLACTACHDPNDTTLLHLADTTTVEFGDTMALCAQCHGPQHRDYQHGSHGGMTGYWDLTRGPRSRNHCVDCHSPHTPSIEPVLPVHLGRDGSSEGH